MTASIHMYRLTKETKLQIIKIYKNKKSQTVVNVARLEPALNY